MALELDQLTHVFGETWYKPPLFYSRAAALRFELARGSHAIDRMHSALVRASRIASAALGSANDLILAVVMYGDQSVPEGHQVNTAIRELGSCGLPGPEISDLRILEVNEASPEQFAYQLCVPIDAEHLDRVLWACIASELGVSPNVNARLFAASCARGRLMHIYDDRGMDVIGTTVDTLRPLYEEYNQWLLNHDRNAMKEVFED